MTIPFQNLRSAIPGAQPAQLDPGQVAFNVSDATMYLGNGADNKIDFSGAVVTPNPPAGKGWVQVLLNRVALNDFFIQNPEAAGRPAPTNEQVLTYNATLGVAEWQDAGTGFAYATTNTAVAAAPGATTSQKITSAIGSPAYIGSNATAIVVGNPGETYEGLYIYNGTIWVFAAHYAFNTATQVPATNPTTLAASTTQAVLNALKLVDDGIQTQVTGNSLNIGVLQGQMATAQTDITGLQASKLDKASNIPTPNQILSYDGVGQLWINDSQGDVTGVSGTAPITVNNTNPQTPVVGISAASTTAAGAVQLSNATNSVSEVLASTPLATKTAYDLADAAVPRSTYAAAGDIVVGTGAGTFGPLGIGTAGQVLTVVAGNPAWTDDAPGDVTGVTGTAPITVDNTDPQTPIVGVELATTATPGVVQVELTGNLTLVGGIIDVPNASTTVKGAVSLNNTLGSTSTTEALTAAQGNALQNQIDALLLSNSVTLAGGYDATTGLVDGVTSQGIGAGFVEGATPPLPAVGNADYYLICTTAGNIPSTMSNGDWLLSDGTQYVVLGVGARPASASYTVAGIVQLADAAAVLAGTSDTTAITPQALQDNVIDSVTTANSSQIASATAVKTANDNAVAANTAAGNAQTTANNALPKAGGTMTGTITAQNVNVQGTYSLQFAGGVQGSLNAVTDLVNVTSSTTAASATAVKAANDAAVAAQTTANAALPRTGGTMTGNITFQDAGEGVVFSGGSSIIAISDATGNTNNDVAASSTAVKNAYALADAAIPKATFTTAGQLLYGTGAGTYNVLPIGTNGQSLIVSAGAIAWGASLQGYTCIATPFNTALGANAGDSVTTGVNNTALGYNAGTAITAGLNNTFVGFNAGDGTTSADNNTAVGSNALGNTGGNNNTAIGFCSAGCLSSGGGNTLIGGLAGRCATTADNITAVGYNALSAVHTATGTVAVGVNALAANTSGAGNTALGYNAGCAITTGSNNTILGLNAGDTVTTGTQNTFIGACSGGLAANTTEGNTGLGFSALGAGVISGAYNTALGNNAGSAVTSGAINTFVGFSAGSAVTTGGSNTIIGRYAGTAALANNVVLSDGAGTIRFQATSTGAWSPDGVSYGTAGQVLTSGGTGTAPTWTTPQIGDITAVTAGTGLTGGGTSGDVTLSLANTAVVAASYTAANVTVDAQGRITAASNGSVIAPSLLTTTGDIIYASAASTPARLGIGTAGQVLTVSGGVPVWTGSALEGYTQTVSPFNTALGANAGNSLTSGTNNVSIGHDAGTQISSGTNNVFVGFQAGDSITTGGNNIAIGAQAMAAATIAVNNLAIGFAALGYGAAGGGNTAIGLGAGANVTTGSNNTLIAQNAGDAITTGSNNVAMGFNALTALATNGNSVAIGNNALAASTAGCQVAVGYCALATNGTGLANTAVGYFALSSVVAGNQNTALGFGAGQFVSGQCNTVVGYNAGNAITVGGNNIFVGNTAGDAVTTGSSNTIIGDVAGTAALANNLILAAGTTTKLQVNENGAVGVGTTPAYGTAGQVLTSGGTAAAPTWTTPSVPTPYTDTFATVSATPINLLSFSGTVRMGPLTVMLTDNATNVAWANITIASNSGVGSSIVTTSAGTFGTFTVTTNVGNDTLVAFTPSATLASVNAVYNYTASFGSEPTVL